MVCGYPGPETDMTRPLVFLDTETTGLDPEHHEIIEICMSKLSPEVAATIECPERHGLYFLTLPMRPDLIDPKAIAINGFNMDEWIAKGATEFAEVADQIADFMEGCTLVGFNPWFDLRFLFKSIWRSTGRIPEFNYHVVDLCSVAWPLKVAGLIKSVSAKSICELFEIDYAGAHRACNDVDLSIECYRRLMEMRLPV